VVKENYERRRYGLPGGRVEPGESPLDAVVRETLEETCVEVRIDHVVGIYRLVNGFTVHVFRCAIVDGVPSQPDGDEIAEVGWFARDGVPEPRTNILHHALDDIYADARGVVRDGLPRRN
jgi:ADP-ribose pyrophosphatase YjhB (NUDIX family)